MFKSIIIVTLMLLATTPAKSALVTAEAHFFQDGFSGGGSVTGFFRGTDLDGDGQIYAASPTLNMFLGIPVGNELDYAEITFNGLGTTLGAQTIIYDRNQADIFNPINTFFGFAYNIGSGIIGDEANEGISFSPFAPSTNYLLGEAFLGLFINSIAEADRSSFGTCDGINNCGAVLELVFDPNNGLTTVSQNLSSSIVNVPEPTALGFLLLFPVWLLRARIN